MNRKFNLLLIFTLLLLPLFSACSEAPLDNDTEGEGVVAVEESEAIQYLSGQTFNKHTGEGADRLSFVGNNRLIVSIDDGLPPYIADLEDFEEYEDSETIEFENIELKDTKSGAFLVIYEGNELLQLMINEAELLEAEDGTTYMKN